MAVFCVCWKTELSWIAQLNTQQIKEVLTLLWTLNFQDKPRENTKAIANLSIGCSFLQVLLKKAANVVYSALRRKMNPFDVPSVILVHHSSILCNKQESDKKAFGFLDNCHLPYAKLKNRLCGLFVLSPLGSHSHCNVLILSHFPPGRFTRFPNEIVF